MGRSLKVPRCGLEAKDPVDGRGRLFHFITDHFEAPEPGEAKAGGDGYLGWPTALHLSAAGHEVAVCDNFARRGYEALFLDHVTQANEGCDFDFLRTEFGAPVAEPVIY